MDTPYDNQNSTLILDRISLKNQSIDRWGKSNLETSFEIEYLKEKEISFFMKENEGNSINGQNGIITSTLEMRNRGNTTCEFKAKFVETIEDSEELFKLVSKIDNKENPEIDEISSVLRSSTIPAMGKRSRGSKKINMTGRILVSSFNSTAQSSPTSNISNQEFVIKKSNGFK